MTTFTCEGCMAEFTASPSQRKQPHVFCSATCANRRKQRAMVEFACETCRTVVRRARTKRGGDRFCSLQCRTVRPTDRVLRKGYWVVRVPREQRRGRAWRMEHICIAERALGRPLRRGEIVHHINADKADNRPSNLLICTQSYHNALHARMSYLFQRQTFGEVAA